MGLFSLFARCFAPRKQQSFLDRLAAHPLSPRKLEKRRVLDAAALSAVLTPLGDGGEFVQAGANLDSPTSQPPAALNGANTAPDNVEIVPVDDLLEGGTATLQFTFDDPDFADTHTVTIDWGDGTAAEIIELTGGERFVATTHQYKDDNPSDTAFDLNQINISIVDSGGAEVLADTSLTVTNVAPKIDSLSVTPTLFEGETAELELEFSDPGALDTHTVTIDWGDGSTIETIELTGGERFVFTTHQYKDDNPSGTAVDVNKVKVTITDDDTGADSAMADVTVTNRLPTVSLNPVDMIDEGSAAVLSGKINDDGVEDTFELEILWADGAEDTFLLGNSPLTQMDDGIDWDPVSREFSVAHVYVDDDPTMTTEDVYVIGVKVADDDGLESLNSELVTVKNVGPTIDTFTVTPQIVEGQSVELNLEFTDPGLADTHMVEIDWGDGSPLETITLTGGERFVFTTHQYKDDNPSNTSFDNYQVKVKLSDDDGGSVSDMATVQVDNALPKVTLNAVTMINENGVASLSGKIEDLGVQDSFELTINWGDPTSPNNAQTFQLGTTALTEAADGIKWDPTTRTFSLTHKYLDDNPTLTTQDSYSIAVKATDDDTGEGEALASVLVKNVAPDVTLQPVSMINENGMVTLSGAIVDAGTQDTFLLTILWGDALSPPTAQNFTLGTAALTEAVDGINWDPVTRTFSLSHKYLDDNPTNSSQNLYAITAHVVDDDLGVGTDGIAVLVKNVPPVIDSLTVSSPVDEGGSANLDLEFTDPGTLDTHTVTIDWGDGKPPEVINLAVGERFLATSHQYDDDNPSITPQDNYTVTVTIRDDDTGQVADSRTVLVKNVEPVVTIDGEPITSPEGTQINLTSSVIDPGTLDTFTYAWEVTVGGNLYASGSGSTFSFTPADDGAYEVKLTVNDDDSGVGTDTVTITIDNVDPTLNPVADQNTLEGSPFNITQMTFSDPGFSSASIGASETFTYTINWGDGTLETLQLPSSVVNGSPGMLTTGTIDDSHTYADNGVYTVTVTLVDDNGGMSQQKFDVTVGNVDPTLDPVADQNTLEGSLFQMTQMTFSDAGFTSPSAGTTESFTYTINWGDGTVETMQLPSGVTNGSPGVLTTGTIDDSHHYADNGVYTVTVTLFDDDGGSGQQTFEVTVGNVDPTLNPVADQNTLEGSHFNITQMTFSDPAFSSMSAGTTESFTYTINWGDGTVETMQLPSAVTNGSPGVLTTGTIDDSHHYADNGTYTVTVTLFDDDGGMSEQMFDVVVGNVDPTLNPVADQNTLEGSLFQITQMTFSDPGFTSATAGTSETFTYTINWGDGTVETLQLPSSVLNGSPGVLTTGTINDSHTYADNGTYTVTVTLMDDDGGMSEQMFDVVVGNVDPTLNPVANQNTLEGSVFQMTQMTFSDPGFTRPSAGTSETFTYTINWGDGTIEIGQVPSVTNGSPGVPTMGTIDDSHIYADNGTYTVTVAVFDDDGGESVQQFDVVVGNVNPTVDPAGDQTTLEGSLFQMTEMTFSDPGFSSPNAAYPGGQSFETFTYTINWGDGTVESGQMPTSVANGGPNVLTTGKINDTHTFADNGEYLVTVTVFDDDLGSHSQSFKVTVGNVDPTLVGTSGVTIKEGEAFTLAQLGVQISDPGFDNPLNPNQQPGGSKETFVGMKVIWGDGTESTLDVDDMTRINGAPGTPTIADFLHAAHTYADNGPASADGKYTVTVIASDDDGDFVMLSFEIEVTNVDPTLTLNDQVIVVNEGDVLDLSGMSLFGPLGTFSDPGFSASNSAYSGGQSVETFTYSIDWGDGTPEETLLVPANTVNGDVGVLTTGTLHGTHVYEDNDADSIFTITVTITDDDGGVTQQSFNVRVNNVNPTLDPLIATDVNTKGETVLTLTFDDPGIESRFVEPGKSPFTVLVDWGDKLDVVNPADRFVVAELHAGPTPQSFIILHTYAGPPDPDNPAADIVISVKIRDDDFGNPLVVDDGESNVQVIAITNPGIGTDNVRIDTTPEVPRLEFRREMETEFLVGAATATDTSLQGADLRASSAESKATTDRVLELRVVDSYGNESEGIQLNPNVLKNLPKLFANLPDNHYKIYIKRLETNSERLVIEVYVRNGKVIDRGDDSEGTRDRPPTDEASRNQGAQPQDSAPVEEIIEDLDAGATPDSELFFEPVDTGASHEGSPLGLMPMAVGLAATKSFGTWAQQVDRAVAAASSRKWRELRRRIRDSRKNR